MPKSFTWSWNYFTKREETIDGKKKIVGYCQFCNPNCGVSQAGRYVDNAGRQEKHLQSCKKVGAETRVQIDRLSKKASGEPLKKVAKESEEHSARPSTPAIKGFFDNISIAGTGIFAINKRNYAWNAVETMDAHTWWKAWFSDTLLCKVVEMLHNVPISAAPTERNWSLRGGIHTKIRNQMKVNTASQVVFIKHNLLLEYAGLFKKMSVSSPDVEEEESEAEDERNSSNDEIFMDDVD